MAIISWKSRWFFRENLVDLLFKYTSNGMFAKYKALSTWIVCGWNVQIIELYMCYDPDEWWAKTHKMAVESTV